MSERDGEPTILAENVWVKFLIRYHRTDVTLREMFVDALRSVSGGNGARRSRQEFWALRDINFAAHPGEVVGIVGRNGSGKTTFLKSVAGICSADRGRLTVHGKVGCLLSFGVGFNPHLSGRENVFLSGSILGLPRRDIDRRLESIIEFAELGDFIDAPVRTYSAGMKGRLGFSIAIHIDPDILVLDEVLGVGDAAFRAKAGSILDRFRNTDKTVILATHNMEQVRSSCTRAVWLEGGSIVMSGTPDEVVDAYTAASDVREQPAAV
ncbi:Teichoic acids export ATP-binding protein TagH [Phycisphaerae bacterium RAS1]|nr:Teichoic acids export ATP-binding protein TagH [Phycisphaerae bacterium RAS1]